MTAHAAADTAPDPDRFATLVLDRTLAVPVETLWQAWTSPVARAVWAPPGPGVTVEFLETSAEVGGREVSVCKAEGYPDIRAEVRWLHLDPNRCSVNSEVITSDSGTDAAALVTADLSAVAGGSRLVLTVQMRAFAPHMQDGYRQGYGVGVANLAEVAGRMIVLTRRIAAPVATVWGAWWNADSLPQWWGPEGFTCRTARIDLREGGEWVFDMIGPDGTVWPNHHRYGAVVPGRRLTYDLHAGVGGPRHAQAWAGFDADAGGTVVTLGMLFDTPAEADQVRAFGAEELGLQTLGKLARRVGAA